MNKTQALERLTALENEAYALRKIIEAPEPATSLLTKPTPGSGDTYWRISTSPAGYSRLEAHQMTAFSDDERQYKHGDIFATKEQAKAYAEAVDTMLLLRHQPGTVPATNVWSTQRFIEMDHDDLFHDDLLRVECCQTTIRSHTTRISPAFATQEDGMNAIKAIGKDRILRMFKTFHHVAY